MRVMKGISASKGAGIGEIKIITRRYSGLNRVVNPPEMERDLFDAACLLAKNEIAYQVHNAQGTDEKNIYDFQRSVLEDESLLCEIHNYIMAGAGAAAAVERASRIFEKKILSIDDEYIKQRSVDIKDACNRVVDVLDGKNNKYVVLEKPMIIVADDIFPSDLMGIDRRYLQGFITSDGSPQSHAAIVARTLGIPAIVMVGEKFDSIPDGTTIAFNGTTGDVYIDPDKKTLNMFRGMIETYHLRKKELSKLKHQICTTKDGTRVKLFANCSTVEDVKTAIGNGADGIGLVRTELIVENNASIPTEQEQFEYYVACLRAANGKDLTIRTFDFGTDKPVPAMLSYNEINPALGLRGIRLCMQKPAVIITQLKAILRAGQYGNMRVMIPMISRLEEIENVENIRSQAERELQKECVPYCKTIKWGYMVETPSMALLAENLAEKADFLSIGSNDLTQYTHAVDRANALVEWYYPKWSDAVGKLIEMVVVAGKNSNIPVCICGELASDMDALPKLLRTGITDISVSPVAISEIKQFLNNHIIEK